jgi:hypothetical protein
MHVLKKSHRLIFPPVLDDVINCLLDYSFHFVHKTVKNLFSPLNKTFGFVDKTLEDFCSEGR